MTETYWIDCTLNGAVIASYPFRVPSSLAAPPTPDHAAMIADAKENLTNQGIAFPPYAGIAFPMRRG